jgi:hypothetical protein
MESFLTTVSCISLASVWLLLGITVWLIVRSRKQAQADQIAALKDDFSAK